jgi:hypothetical protein
MRKRHNSTRGEGESRQRWLTSKHDVRFVRFAGNASVGANERCHALVQLVISRSGA